MNDIPILDFEDLLVRIGGERDFAIELLQEFVESLSGDIADLKTALEASDTQDSVFKAHTLKGSAANLSAKALSEVTRIVEEALRENDLETARSGVPNLEEAASQLKERFASLGET